MATSATVSHHKARVAAFTRSVRAGERLADDPEVADARRDLYTANLEVAVRKCLAKSPRPRDEQLQHIAAILLSGGGA